MGGVEFLSVPLASHFKFFAASYLTNDTKRGQISIISYDSVVDNLMYVMVCMRSNIAHVVKLMSRYKTNLCKIRKEVVK